MICAFAVMGVLAATLIYAQKFLLPVDTSVNGEVSSQKKPKPELPLFDVPYSEVQLLAKKLDASRIADVEPGEKAFEAARELLVEAKFPEAEEKLKYILTYYPTAPSAPEARRILGEMNMDRLLAPIENGSKKIYEVKSGDSFSRIVAREQTHFDLVVHLNSLQRSDRLHPGDKLLVMPLNFRLVLDKRNAVLSLWDRGSFVKDFPILEDYIAPSRGITATVVERREVRQNDRAVNVASSSYRTADKLLLLKKPRLEVRAVGEFPRDGFEGCVISAADMEELALLIRPGNTVEIRY